VPRFCPPIGGGRLAPKGGASAEILSYVIKFSNGYERPTERNVETTRDATWVVDSI
jgi:hypothetical protein